MGSSRRPDGATLTVDSRSLLLNDRAWTPVMGEFHYARYPEKEWREELLKMKAGGIDIVSTYVFWIHHEEIEGQFDWSGSRNLRLFIQLCQQAGLKAFVRCGPWDHGEVRNGGFPDWLLQKGWKTVKSNRSCKSGPKAASGLLPLSAVHQVHGLSPWNVSPASGS